MILLFIQDIFLDKQAWWPKDVFCQNENQNNKKIKEKAVKIERIAPRPPLPPPQKKIKDVALFSCVRYCAIYLI